MNFPVVQTFIVRHLDSDALTLEHKYNDLVRRKRDIEAEVSNLNMRISNMDGELASMTIVAAMELEKVRHAYLKMCAEYGIVPEPDAFEIKFEREPPSDQATKLFRKIARMTHADVADDPALHNLFDLAQKMREANDVEGLTKLHTSIMKSRASSLLESLMSRINALALEIDSKNWELQSIKDSNQHLLLEMWEAGNREPVIQLVLNNTNNKIVTFKAKMHELLMKKFG